MGADITRLVKTRFKEGESKNDYVDCRIIRLDGKLLARLKIASRRRCVFPERQRRFHVVPTAR